MASLLVTPLAGCGGDSETNEVATTTTPPAVTTTAPPRATTTTAYQSPGDTRDIEVLSAVLLLQGSERTRFIEIIEESLVLERVDVFAVDVVDGTITTPGTVTLRIEGSTGYSTEEYQIENIWELVSTVAMFWEAGNGLLRNDDGKIKPGLVIVVDGRRHVASYDQMVQVEERRISQAEWIASTRQ